MPDNDPSFFHIEELLGGLSLTEALPAGEEHCPSNETPPDESRSPGTLPEESGFVTPEPARRFSGHHLDHLAGSPEMPPDEWGFVTPEPTMFFSRRHRLPDPDSP